MAYGILKCDTITFTDGGVDKSVSISGLVQNPTFSGSITVVNAISGNTIQGQTVSSVTVTGTTAAFTTGTFISLTGTTIQGTTATYTTGSFTSLTGTTTTGTTANFVSGVYTTRISGATITGNSAAFTTVTGGTATITSGVFASGTAAAPSVSVGTTDNGIYSPGTDQVAISTNSLQRLAIDASGNINIDSGGVYYNAVNNRLAVGTTSPDYLLDCQKTGSQQIRSRTNDTGSGTSIGGFLGEYLGGGGGTNTQISIAAGNNYGFLSTLTNSPLFIGTNSTEKLRIDTSGRVLIGTTVNSGGALLQVNDNRIRIATAKTPASATDTGTAGEICWDTDYVYVCTATNTWKRSALSTW